MFSTLVVLSALSMTADAHNPPQLSRDCLEDVRDRREDRLDRAEDIRDARTFTGPADLREDRLDRLEDIRDLKEDRRDRLTGRCS
ncbi:MAG TPA: hypothetical protein QGF58_11460 [Myxococcota bacterium]|nr:hypothetical protein [Myxococcota bacterium]